MTAEVIYIITKVDHKGNLVSVEGAYHSLDVAHTVIRNIVSRYAYDKKYEYIVITRVINRDYER